MYKLNPIIVGIAMALATTGCSLLNPSLNSASEAAGVKNIQSIEFSGTGRWYQFGQAPNPDLPWPPFDIKSFTADINYSAASARVQISRLQVVEAGRNRPLPVEQKVDQYISGNTAWNKATAANASPANNAQPAAVEERVAEIWESPQGFLKAALVNHADSESVDNGTKISFSLGDKYRFIGIINDDNQLVQVKTCIDNPVLGDTVIESQYSDYKDFGGLQFPAHIVRSAGGFPILDLTVSAVKINPTVDISIPTEASNPPTISVAVKPLANGVYYLTGGTHHSVAIEQRDHIVVVEAPLNEDRSQAVIAKIKEIIPNKPIKYLINSHAHFDHSGGLRTYVDAGATIVTEQANQAYYQKVWAYPHKINPDRLSQSNKPAIFESFTGKHTLSDGSRDIEIYSLAGNSHNDAFDVVYLPKEKILIEADAYTPTAGPATTPSAINPYSLNLYENIRKLKLDVNQIAGLHGRDVPFSDLLTTIGLQKAQN
jgi:glyoxylase-like metal-dependent hydrolase (beta-lactamase superfamily II)